MKAGELFPSLAHLNKAWSNQGSVILEKLTQLLKAGEEQAD